MSGLHDRRKSGGEEGEDWLVTYADAITLLMAFFVMMLTFAKFDVPAYEQLKDALAKNVGGRKDVVSPTKLLKIEVQDAVFHMGADKSVTVSQDQAGVVIELASSNFYKPGSADIRDSAKPVLKKIADLLKAPRYSTYDIEVDGHTDDVPISTPQFPSNWELSTDRADRVVRFFIKQGIDAKKLKAAGYADTRPKVPNLDPNGKPIPENRATNRRTVLHVTPMTEDEKRAYLQQIAREEDLKRRLKLMKQQGAPQKTNGAAPATQAHTSGAAAPPATTQPMPAPAKPLKVQ